MNNLHAVTATHINDVEAFSLLDSIVEQSRIARNDEEHHRAKSLIAELAKEVMDGPRFVHHSYVNAARAPVRRNAENCTGFNCLSYARPGFSELVL